MENGANKKSSPVVPAAATASLFLPPPAMKPNTASSTMEVKKVVAPPLPDGRLPVQLKPLLPRDIPGWQPDGKLRFAIPSTLYDLIDGGAEVYLEYGFVKSLRKDYSKGSDSFLTVDVYYMKDEAAAFGIFSSERSPGEASAGVGRDSAINDNEIKFWQDKYFIKITGDASKQEFIAMAKDISSAIGAVGGGVPELSMRAAGCPKAAANSLLLIRGPLALRRFFFFSDKDIFAFKSGTTGLSYQISGDAKTSAAVMKVKDKKTAPQIAENIKSALKGKGFNPAATGSSAIAGYTYFEKTGKRIGLLVKGDKINIVLVSQD
jgi:hypothetical protein